VEEPGVPWVNHPYKFAEAGAQMLVYDVDGDGLADVITSWHCHLYGLVWHQQQRSASGEITWKKHVILPSNPDVKSSDLRISQMHGLDLADMNGDGLKDIVTGKRFWAHGPTGDAEPDAPAVLYWFELQTRQASRRHALFPHQIDDNSGVGTQVTAVDLNGDGIPGRDRGQQERAFSCSSVRRRPLDEPAARVYSEQVRPVGWTLESALQNRRVDFSPPCKTVGWALAYPTNWEAGENPARPRHCDRRRTPHG
jgi:hypothetical protein